MGDSGGHFQPLPRADRPSRHPFLAMLLQGRWRHLPHAYNAQKRIKYHHPELWDLSQIAVIHYGEATLGGLWPRPVHAVHAMQYVHAVPHR
jgi:lipopolysaccharide biosynthesis glycosyltransferase